MPIFDAISSLFSHRAVSAVTSPSISSTGAGSNAIVINTYGNASYATLNKCSASKYVDDLDELIFEQPTSSCGKRVKSSCSQSSRSLEDRAEELERIRLLEELRRIEGNAELSEKEHGATREFLLKQLAHYENELLKVRRNEVVVKEHRVPVPVHVPVKVPIRVPEIHRETRVVSSSPCMRSSLCPWRGSSCGRAVAAASPCARGRSLARLVAGANASPCAKARAASCNSCSRYGIDVSRYRARLDELTHHERALSKRLSARRSVTRKVSRTLSKLQRAHQTEQQHLAKIANDKRRTVSQAFKELQTRKEEEYRRHAEHITDELRAEQERLADHMGRLNDWRETKLNEMRRLEESAAIALRSYDMDLRRRLAN